MVNWNEGSNHNPIDPKAVKIGAEQAGNRGINLWAELRFLLSRAWAGVSWPARIAGRLATRRTSGRDG